MTAAATDPSLELGMEHEQDVALQAALEREGPRLVRWLRRQLADPALVEDVLQDVFYELVLAYRLSRPIGQVGAWLFRVARNRVTDLFRRRTVERRAEPRPFGDDESAASWEERLPSLAAGPDAAYAHALLLDTIDEALAELPAEQREVFLAHELEGLSFREMSALSGVPLNTLLSRKRYAVLHLRQRLRDVHEDFRSERGERP
jgi:RNA polymerase sigma factor (sigma-70 family)